jgi:hypothetical protein
LEKQSNCDVVFCLLAIENCVGCLE